MTVRNIIPFVPSTAMPMSRAAYCALRVFEGAFVLAFLAAGWYLFNRSQPSEQPIIQPPPPEEPSPPKEIKEGRYADVLAFLSTRLSELDSLSKAKVSLDLAPGLPKDAYNLFNEILTLEDVQAAMRLGSKEYMQLARDRLANQLQGKEVDSENFCMFIGLLHLNNTLSINCQEFARKIQCFAKGNNDLDLFCLASLLEAYRAEYFEADNNIDPITELVNQKIMSMEPDDLIDQYSGFICLLAFYSSRSDGMHKILVNQCVGLLERHGKNIETDSRLETWIGCPLMLLSAQKKRSDEITKLADILIPNEIAGQVKLKYLTGILNLQKSPKFTKVHEEFELVKALASATECQDLLELDRVISHFHEKGVEIYVDSCLHGLQVMLSTQAYDEGYAIKWTKNIEEVTTLNSEQIRHFVLCKKQIADLKAAPAIVVEQPVGPPDTAEKKYAEALEYLAARGSKLPQKEKAEIAMCFASDMPEEAYKLLSKQLTVEDIQVAIELKSTDFQKLVRDRLKTQLGKKITAKNIRRYIGLLYLNKSTGIETEDLAKKIWKYASSHKLSLECLCKLFEIGEKLWWVGEDATEKNIQLMVMQRLAELPPSEFIGQYLGFKSLLSQFNPEDKFHSYLFNQCMEKLKSHGKNFQDDPAVEMWLGLPAIECQKAKISGLLLAKRELLNSLQKSRLAKVIELINICVPDCIEDPVDFGCLFTLAHFERITGDKYAARIKHPATLSQYVQIKRLVNGVGQVVFKVEASLSNLAKVLADIQTKTPGMYVESCLHVVKMQLEEKIGKRDKVAELIGSVESREDLTPAQISKIVILKKQLADWA